MDSDNTASEGASRRPAYVRISVETYHALGERGLFSKQTELLHGYILNKPAKSPFHSLLTLRLLKLLQACLPAGHFLQSEQPLTFADSEPEPDVSVVKGSVEDFPQSHPTTAELVVEVCVTSHDYDRDKLSAYAAAGVKEAWLVLGPERQVEVFRQPEGGRYAESQVLTADATLSAAALPGVTVPLMELFRG